MNRNDVQDIMNGVGSMYASVLFLGIQNAMTIQHVVGVERTVFYRERVAGMYSSMPYAIAQVIIMCVSEKSHFREWERISCLSSFLLKSCLNVL